MTWRDSIFICWNRDKPSKDTFERIHFLKESFKISKNKELRELLGSGSPGKSINHYDLKYSPTIEEVNSPQKRLREYTQEQEFDKPFPSIEALCKHLLPVEIEHVCLLHWVTLTPYKICRDPLYFLGLDVYRKDPNLTDMRKWIKIGRQYEKHQRYTPAWPLLTIWWKARTITLTRSELSFIRKLWTTLWRIVVRCKHCAKWTSRFPICDSSSYLNHHWRT